MPRFLHILHYCLIGVLLFPGARVFAQDKLNFFQATVPVTSQQRSERVKVTEDAFLQVLIRMSGNSEIIYNDAILLQLDRASRYIQQYQYEDLDSEALREQGFTERLSVSFSQSAVRKVLSQAGLPYWADNRPTTLVWLVEDSEEFGRGLLNQYSDSDVVRSLGEAAGLRGLPLSFPVLDLEDQQALAPDDVWDFNEEAIIEASQRYAADVILVGRYSMTSAGDIWSIWQFFHAGATQSYDARIDAENIAAGKKIGPEALSPLADFLASRYAFTSSGELSDRLVVQLSGVKDFSDYRKSLDYFEGLAAISNLQVAAVRVDSMLLYLASDASVEKLLSVITLDNKLSIEQDDLDVGPVWQSAPKGSAENPLKFNWSS
ncbi:MAG: DUF2066 domain-containing protein [Agarilytica sp.]